MQTVVDSGAVSLTGSMQPQKSWLRKVLAGGVG